MQFQQQNVGAAQNGNMASVFEMLLLKLVQDQEPFKAFDM